MTKNGVGVIDDGVRMLLWLLATISFANEQVEIVEQFSPSHYDDALERLSGSSSVDATHLSVYGKDSNGNLFPVEELLFNAPPVPNKGDGVIGVDLPGSENGFLNGKEVYLSQSHGWIWFGYPLFRFSTQRGEQYGALEDFHNTEGINQFLIQYLENAGAAVFTTRERDMNPSMAIADNDADGYYEEGDGFEDGNLGFTDLSPWLYGENPFQAGTTRRFPSDSNGIATWIPDVPSDGKYALYVSWDSDESNDPSAHYRIHHNGGIIDRYFDQRIHGSTWQYVETLWLESGVDSLKVELLADSTESGKWLSADAVRIGGGMGDVERQGDLTGRPRWEGGAIQYIQFNGAPTSVYNPYWEEEDPAGGSDPSSRSRWAKWEHPAGIDAVYISWHSNGCDSCSGDPRGAETYHYSGNYTPVNGSAELAQFVQSEVMNFIHANWDSSWPDRGVRTAAYSELTPAFNDEMPKALLELGFHDNEIDAWHLLNPLFRRDASRAIYRAVVGYFAMASGVEPVYLPEPPQEVAVVQDGGTVTVSWKDGLSQEPYGDPPTAYRVYLSDDGRAWDNGTTVSSRVFEFDISPEQVRYVRVASVNAGGVSFPSEILSVYSVQESAPILLVSGFDRLDNAGLIEEYIPGVGTPLRMYLEQMNGYDGVIPYSQSLGQLNWGFDSISDEAFITTDLSRYSLIIWIAGEESSVDTTISQPQQERLSAFLDANGRLFISGSEILWDLDEMGDDVDIAFAETRLGALLDYDSSETYQAHGVGLLDGLNLNFSTEDGAPYDVDYPDVLISDREPAARYGTDQLAAVIGNGVFFMGFPFESIGSQEERDALMARVLFELMPASPDVSSVEEGEPKEEIRACACSSTQTNPLAPCAMAILVTILVRRNTQRG